MSELETLVVGGSLSGLTFALACARRGIKTLLLERTSGSQRGGSALGINRDLLLRVIGQDTLRSHSFPVLAGKRQASTWQSVHVWLCRQTLEHNKITLIEDVSVVEVAQDADGATAVTAGGQRYKADLVVGADGYRSVVRRAIDYELPAASYAGYLLWRGLVVEADLRFCHFPQQNEGIALVNKDGYRLIAYPVANSDGSLAVGQRLISFTWYDPGRYNLLRDLHCVSAAGHVLCSLVAEKIPPATKGELCELARRIWPDPWRSVIIHALEHDQVFATPVAEYIPRRLHRGRLAIIGDAAHAVSPVTGKGFIQSIHDADVLAESLARIASGSAKHLAAALEIYEAERLPQALALGAASRTWSKAFRQNEQTFLKIT